MTSDFPMVDAHVHFWDPTRHYYPWLNDRPLIPVRYGDYSAICRPYLPADYKRDAGPDHNVVKTVYLEAEWDPKDPIGEMDFIAELRRDTGWPNVAIGQAWLDRADIAEVLESHAARGFVRGVRQKPPGSTSPKDVRPGAMSDPHWRAGFARLRPLGLHFDLQTPWWNLAEAAGLARAFPDTPIVLLHTGLPADRSREGLAGWKAGMSAFAACPNASVKISGIGLPGIPWTAENNREVVLTTIDLFGVDRSMFGSNFPVDSVCGDLRTIFSGYKTITAGFSADERRKMFHDNAIRIYRIDG
jgi:predicted TIM-barrel fold metal-dependent hydrolase